MDNNQRIARQVGAAIRRLRVQRGLAQDQLAAAAGIPVATVAAYEGGREDPDVQTRRQLLAACASARPSSAGISDPGASQAIGSSGSM
jgi:transcriptional regulator with XRE-family HTH domain